MNPLIILIFIIVLLLIIYIITRTIATPNNPSINTKVIVTPNNPSINTKVIPIAYEFEVLKMSNIICLGTKGNKENVRAIKLGNELRYVPYSEHITWKLSNDGMYVVLNDTTENTFIKDIKIPIEYAVYTGHQCWGTNMDEIEQEPFEDYLKRFLKYIYQT